MRRHAVSTMSNNFGYMYINLFQKRYLASELAKKKTYKKFMHRAISHYNK